MYSVKNKPIYHVERRYDEGILPMSLDSFSAPEVYLVPLHNPYDLLCICRSRIRREKIRKDRKHDTRVKF